ncbi:hypothetical protein VXR58_15485 [Acinetobacter pittii]|uniref:hypothetical protein n=1 Tax=Acinetobacter pittii TaxID=48296 RepID=UPI003A86DF23
MNRIDDVFKVARQLPLNYIERDHVDNKFIDALTQDCHIVIHGSSKQGKTSLRKNNLQESDYIDITCSNNWTLKDIHEAILKKAGYEVVVSKAQTIKGTAKVSLKGNIPYIVSSGLDVTGEIANQVNKKNLEIDIEDVNDVVNALKHISFKRYIVLEDFHYLPQSTQIDFAFALKAFHEQSTLCFIIVGVWLEDDRIRNYNDDLDGRITSINADLWKPQDFEKLLLKSEELLNIKFHENFRNIIKNHCNGSIFLAQKLCRKVCSDNNIFLTSPVVTTIGESFDHKAIITEILSDQNGRYFKFLTDFSAGFDQTDLDLYRWMLYGLIEIDKSILEKGLADAALKRLINEKHTKEISLPKLHQALRKAVDLQVKIQVRPIIFEYDPTTRYIKIVDKSFLLWREYQEKTVLFEYAGLDV